MEVKWLPFRETIYSNYDRKNDDKTMMCICRNDKLPFPKGKCDVWEFILHIERIPTYRVSNKDIGGVLVELV